VRERAVRGGTERRNMETTASRDPDRGSGIGIGRGGARLAEPGVEAVEDAAGQRRAPALRAGGR
jgi:hypothetical protein